MESLTLSPKFQEMLNNELAPNESVRWTWEPNPRTRYIKGTLGCWAFFALIWFVGLFLLSSPLLLSYYGLTPRVIAFASHEVLIEICSLLMFIAVFGPIALIYTISNPPAIAYVITSTRILVLSGIAGATHARSMFPDQLRGRTVRRRRDGFGDIFFPHAEFPRMPESPDRGGTSMHMTGMFFKVLRVIMHKTYRVGLYGIPNVYDVDGVIGDITGLV